MKYLSLICILLFATTAGLAQSSLEYSFDIQFAELPNETKVAYIDQGEAEQTLILIHGLGSYLPGWSMNIDALADHFRVVALDLPGYGKSSKNADNHTIPFFAESISQLMDHLEIAKATLVGHSMGGQVALYMAAHSPGRVQRLVLSAPAGFEQFSEAHYEMFQATVSAEGIASTTDSMIEQNMKVNFYQFPESAVFMVEDRKAIKNDPNFEDYAQAQSQSVFAMLNEPVWDLLPEIEQPTLVIYGNQDALIPNRYLNPQLTTKAVAEAGVERMPNAELNMIDQAGHFVHFEQAEIFNQAVIKFLNH
ncbi:MAG: alpha/beta fold hydrolase [Gracilimonas sp.]|nr:alpha/beta fold hydrolase [Gracilimonas sp.]